MWVETSLDSLLTQFSLSQNSLDKPCDDNLFLALMSEISRFDNAAPFFGLTQPEIEAIRCDYNDERSRRLNMLWQWKRKNGTNATYLALVTVFLQMEDKTLAEFVMKHTKSTHLTVPNDSKLNPERTTTKCRNWDEMSKAEQIQVKNDLFRENDEVRQKYSNLVLRILKSFEKRKVKVDQLKIKVLAYGIPKPVSRETPATQLPHFKNDNTLDKVFLTMCRHSSWFNIQLLKVIVHGELGCEDVERMLAEYEEKDLLPYLQRSIFEIPSKSFAQGQEDDSARHLYVRLPDGHIPTGHDVYHLRSTISKYLGISEGILQFIGFEEGSIKLIFRIPEALLELQTSIKSHITFDSVNNVYNFNDDELNKILPFSKEAEVTIMHRSSITHKETLVQPLEEMKYLHEAKEFNNKHSEQSFRYQHLETESRLNWDSLNKYDAPPGYCLIINNMNFDQNSTIPCGEVDETAMKRIFQPRGFILDARRDLTKSQMKACFEEYRRKEHTGCFIVIILSHGRDGVVLSRNDQEIRIADIEKEFHGSKCPSLQGKPCIFIINACRVQEDSMEFTSSIQTITDLTRGHFTSASIFQPSRQNEDPEMVDIAIIYATAPGDPSDFDKNEGSLFTQLFENVMHEGVKRNMEFNSIMTEVQNRISRYQSESGSSQTVEIVTRLRKHYYFKLIDEVELARQLQMKRRDLLHEWKGIRETTIKRIRTTAENLVKHHRNVNISRITGSLAAIGGSGIAILGLALTPVTFGTTLGLTIGGASIATAGVVTATGAGIVDTVITKAGVREAQEQLEFDQDKLTEIYLVQDQIKEQNERIRVKCPDLKDVDIFTLTDVFLYAQEIGEVAGISDVEFGFRAAGASAGSMATAGIVLNFVIIPIDIIKIVMIGWNIAQGNETKASQQLREKADELEQQKNKICDQMNL